MTCASAKNTTGAALAQLAQNWACASAPVGYPLKGVNTTGAKALCQAQWRKTGKEGDQMSRLDINMKNNTAIWYHLERGTIDKARLGRVVRA